MRAAHFLATPEAIFCELATTTVGPRLGRWPGMSMRSVMSAT